MRCANNDFNDGTVMWRGKLDDCSLVVCFGAARLRLAIIAIDVIGAFYTRGYVRKIE